MSSSLQVIGGRLVYWVPIIKDDYDPSQVSLVGLHYNRYDKLIDNNNRFQFTPP